jgi:hypothetical protein
MPFKSIEAKRAWRIAYGKKNKDKIRAWALAAYERGAEDRKASKAISDAKIKAKQQRKATATAISWVPDAMAEIRRRIMERDGVARCRACGSIVPREGSYELERETCRCRECRNKAQKGYALKQNSRLIVRVRKYARDRIRRALKWYGARKQEKTIELLGCSYNEYVSYLESKFEPWMTWENYGRLWHIDHIVPVASFDLSQYTERCKCFHFTNTQPLEAKANIRKGGRCATPYPPF